MTAMTIDWNIEKWDTWAKAKNIPHADHPKDCLVNSGYYFLRDGRTVPPCFSKCTERTRRKIIEIIMLGVIENDSPTPDHTG